MILYSNIFFSHPYIWTSFLSGACCAALALKTKGSVIKVVLVNLAVLLFFLGLLESWATVFHANPVCHERFERGDYEDHAIQARFERRYGEGYIVPDEILGYVPRRNMRFSVRKYYDNKLLYSVTYTINKEGLRISPPCEGSSCRDAILFFGGSFTYGEGLNDDEAMPFIVGTLSKAPVYNFGFHGYGPNQMLSAIEGGVIDKTVDVKPKYAISQMAFSQVGIVAGYCPWNEHEPKYILSQDGRIKYAGHFDDSPMRSSIDKFLDRSSIYQDFFKNRVHVSNEDVKICVGIVVAAKKELLAKFPGLEFHVIYWNIDKSKDRAVLERFQKEGIRVHLITDILPKSKHPSTDYLTLDGHPSFTANKYIASYIVEHILHKSNQTHLSKDL